MLLRLRVSGFKNLVDVDVRFGPFTCIAGANGTGKSNLFDALQFLSALADQPLMSAATAVRGGTSRTADMRSLFFQSPTDPMQPLTFVADILVPSRTQDDEGHTIIPATTALQYKLTLGERRDRTIATGADLGRSLEIYHEELVPLVDEQGNVPLAFPHSATWRTDAVVELTGESLAHSQRLNVHHYLSTQEEHSQRTVTLHLEYAIGGNGRTVHAASLSRTMLSQANAAFNPTAMAARLEMRSWRILALDPAKLREPDSLADADTPLAANGAHLPAAIYRQSLSRQRSDQLQHALRQISGINERPEYYFAHLTNRLNELIDDVSDIRIDVDEARQLLTLIAIDRQGTGFTARSLSDGTLRFLALVALEQEYRAGLTGIEEPENGLHPQRIPALLQLLQDSAVDTNTALDADNPLRQVIIATHSPLVVSYVPDDALLFVKKIPYGLGHQQETIAFFQWLVDTWRAQCDPDPYHLIARGDLLAYLQPVISPTSDRAYQLHHHVIDRPDLRPFLAPPAREPEGM